MTPDTRFKKTCNTLIPLVYICSHRMVKHLIVSLNSVLLSSKITDIFDIRILSSDLTTLDKLKIKATIKKYLGKISFYTVDATQLPQLKNSKYCSHVPTTTYYKFLIPIFCEHPKCIYLDIDTLIKQPLDDLFETQIDNYYLAAVEECYEKVNEDAIRLGVTKIINAGVLLINCELWRKNDSTKKLFEDMKKLQESTTIKWMDQDVLNYSFKDRIFYLSKKYNIQGKMFDNNYNRMTEQVEKKEIVIIHFNGKNKPWMRKCDHPLATEYFYSKYHPLYERISPQYILKKMLLTSNK